MVYLPAVLGLKGAIDGEALEHVPRQPFRNFRCAEFLDFARAEKGKHKEKKKEAVRKMCLWQLTPTPLAVGFSVFSSS